MLENGRITWERFIEDAKSMISLSNEISDGWELHGDEETPERAYLTRKMKSYVQNIIIPKYEDSIEIPLTNQREDKFEASTTDTEIPIFTEHHVLWSCSYSVPVIYFNGWKSDFPGINLISMEEGQALVLNTSLNYHDLSQAIHPILHTPFLHLHPCCSQDLLQNTSSSKNMLVSWLSSIAPAALGLRMRSEYFKLTV